MNRKQLASILGVKPKQITEWVKLGLPWKGTARKKIYDQEEVADWLIEQGIYHQPAGIVRKISEVATHFGVAPRTIYTWRDQGMPCKSGRFDLDEIAAWDKKRKAGKKSTSSGDASESASPDVKARHHWEMIKSKMTARKLEMQVAEMERKLVPVDLIVRIFCQHVAEVKSHLEQLPDFVISLLKIPPKQRKRVYDAVDKRIYDLCVLFAKNISELGAIVDERIEEQKD